ncbi:MAG: methyltransferase C-terminal domain-containing protein [Caulobacteraceae bacterium]
MTTPACRFCGAPLTHTFLDLGEQPLSNAFLTADALAAGTERAWPLHARVCDRCFLVQVDDPVDAGDIFTDEYAYFSSYSKSWLEHARRYARMAAERFGLGPGSLVVEIASNDGYLLRNFVEMGVPVLGIEPAANCAEAARAIGVPTEVMFFGEETGKALAARGVRADLMAANNVLAHVPRIGDFVAGFPQVLKPEGVLTFEFPHLLRLIEGVQFDTIYHEHFSYLSMLTVERVLASAGMRVFDVEELPTHGGSLRLFCRLAAAGHAETAAVERLRQAERAAALDRIEGYAGFTQKAEAVRASFLDFLRKAKAEGKTVAAYGAAAKGNTFLNYAGVGPDDIRAVYDLNPHKQGRFLPGSHVPILSPDAIADLKPDYVVILPWNLKDEIMAQLAFIGGWGGRFVTAAPQTRVIGA